MKVCLSVHILSLILFIPPICLSICSWSGGLSLALLWHRYGKVLLPLLLLIFFNSLLSSFPLNSAYPAQVCLSELWKEAMADCVGQVGGEFWSCLASGDHFSGSASVHLFSLPLPGDRCHSHSVPHPALLLCLQWGICPRLWKMS